MIIAGIIAFVFLLVLAMILFGRKEQEIKTYQEPTGSASQQKFPTQHLTGHPSIEEEEYVYLLKEKEEIKIITRNLYQDNSSPNKLGAIPYKAITTIEAEDQSGIEKKFSLGKFMLLGAYAFAWLKKEPKEKAYLVIKWQKDGQEHTTIFRNEDEGALSNVNAACRAITSWVKQNTS
jgi:hypothetical protein